MHFDDRHPEYRWFPWLIMFAFVGVTVTALAVNFSNPLTQISGYLLGLVTVDFGMATVATLAWLMGRLLWREDADPRYLAAAIGFAGLPVWGVLETVCITGLIPPFSESEACLLIPNLSWVAVLWLAAVPVASILIDFRTFLRTLPARPVKQRA